MFGRRYQIHPVQTCPFFQMFTFQNCPCSNFLLGLAVFMIYRFQNCHCQLILFKIALLQFSLFRIALLRFPFPYVTSSDLFCFRLFLFRDVRV